MGYLKVTARSVAYTALIDVNLGHELYCESSRCTRLNFGPVGISQKIHMFCTSFFHGAHYSLKRTRTVITWKMYSILLSNDPTIGSYGTIY
jgi:hypothetical protein